MCGVMLAYQEMLVTSAKLENLSHFFSTGHAKTEVTRPLYTSKGPRIGVRVIFRSGSAHQLPVASFWEDGIFVPYYGY